MKIKSALWFLMVMSVVLVGCTTSDFGVALSTTTVEVDQGGNGTVQIALNRTNLSGNVELSLEGAPSGISGSFNPNPAPASTSTLTLSVGSVVAAGDYALKVKAVAQGITREVSLTLKVKASDFSLSPASANLSINQGASGTVAVNLSRTNFVAEVDLSLEGAPAGVVGSFNPDPAAGNTSTLSLSVAATVATGNYNLTIKGVGGGRTKTANLTLAVQPKPATAITLSTFANTTKQNLDWVAYQDGDGAWQTASGTGGVYSFNVSSASGRYGVAVVCIWDNGQGNFFYEIKLLLLKTSEATSPNMICGYPVAPPTGNTVTLSGDITGSVAGENTRITVASQKFGNFGNGESSYSINVQPGTYDLMALKGTSNGPQFTPNKAILKRGLVVSGNTTANLDFAGGDAFVPPLFTVTVNGGNVGETLSGNASLFSSWGFTVANGSGNTFIYPALPVDRRQPNDVYLINLSANAVSASGGTIRLVGRGFKTPGDLTIDLPPQIGLPTVTVDSTAPYVRFKMGFDAYPGAQLYSISYSSSSTSRSRSWSAMVSAGWLGSNSSLSFTMPDLSGASGWNADWGIPTGNKAQWNLGAFATSLSLNDFLSSIISATPPSSLDGLEVKQVARTGQITP